MNDKTPQSQVLAIICSVFDAYSAILFLPQEGSEDCTVAASFSLGDKISPDTVLQPGASLAGWILRNKQPLLVPNYDQSQSKLGYYDDEEEAQIKAFMGCPVSTGGLLCVDSKRQYSFSDKDHKILQLFAGLIAAQGVDDASPQLMGDIPQYFANLGVIQDLRFHHKRWSDFLQHFVRTVAQATGFEYCAFASIDQGGESFSIEGENVPLLLAGQERLTLPLNSGIAGWVLRDERPPVFSEGTEGGSTASLFGKEVDTPRFNAVVCMPLVINKVTRGVLCLGNTEPKPMDEALRSFMHQSVDHLALFLENLYLKTRLRSMLPKAQLHRHGGMVSNSDDLAFPPHQNPPTYPED